MNQNTHPKIDSTLCGTPVELSAGASKVQLKTDGRMVADSAGLVHGGFLFGLADFAAMLAINDPNVVLGSATTKFLKPVVLGDVLMASAKVVEEKGKKRIVPVQVFRGEELVFEGEFVCFVLEQHVLESSKK